MAWHGKITEKEAVEINAAVSSSYTTPTPGTGVEKRFATALNTPVFIATVYIKT